MNRRTRKLSIRIKFLIMISIIIMVVLSVFGVNIYRMMEEDLVGMGIDQARVAARMAVRYADGDVAGSLKPGDEALWQYQQQLAALRNVKDECNVKFLYTLTTDKNKVYYGIDTDESDQQCAIGEEFEDSYEELKSVFEGEMYVQGYIDSTEDGDLISVYMPLTDKNGTVVAVLGSDYDASVVVGRLEEIRVGIIKLCAIGLFVSFLILWFVVGRLTRNLQLVNEKIYELVHNDGDLTQTLEMKTGDELELLAEDVNALLAYIREIMLQISKNSFYLNDSTKLVVGNLADAGAGIVDVSATMKEMGVTMEETAASVSQVNDSIHEVYTNISHISQQAADGNAVTETIAQKAETIRQKAEREQKEAAALSEQLAVSVNEKIEKSKAVSEISLLTENIIEITDQTNLLSLNASIEAARAGESGRGFAVVAGEIGKLASDSAKAAAKIREVSTQVISAVEELTEEAEKLIHFMKETAMGGYEELLVMSDDYRMDAAQIHEMMENFSYNSAQMMQSIDSIQTAMETVNSAVEGNSKGIANVSEVSEQLSKSVDDIEKKADINKQIAQQLETEVGKFKLE